jgi:hypothetical protein
MTVPGMLRSASLWLFPIAQTPKQPLPHAECKMPLAPVLLFCVTLAASPFDPPTRVIEVEAGTVETAAADAPPRAPASGPSDNKGQAQDNPGQAEENRPPTPLHTGIHALLDGLREDVRHLPSKQNLYLTLIGGGLAAGVHPIDQRFNIRLSSHYDAVNRMFAPAKYYGNTPEQLALSLGTYAFGRTFHAPKVSLP